MSINLTQKEMPAGGCNPTAGGAINGTDFPMVQYQGKALETLRASFALRGHTPHDTALLPAITGWRV